MRIALVSTGIAVADHRLQPWYFLGNLALTVKASGHELILVGDETRIDPSLGDMSTLRFLRVPPPSSLAEPFHLTRLLIAAEGLRPDKVILHMDLTSFLRLNLSATTGLSIVGVLTAPAYSWPEILSLGVRTAGKYYKELSIHLVGALVPKVCIRRCFRAGLIDLLVTESETNQRRVVDRGAPPSKVIPLRPPIGRIWLDASIRETDRADLREKLGFRGEDVVVGFFGPSHPLRGMSALAEATVAARSTNSRIKLLLLSRDAKLPPSLGALCDDNRRARPKASRWCQAVAGNLSREELVTYLLCCDVISLPFRFVPSDVPMSVLEALALAKPVITTRIGCLSELVPEECGVLVPGGDLKSLTRALVELAANRDAREELGGRARKFASWWQGLWASSPVWTYLFS